MCDEEQILEIRGIVTSFLQTKLNEKRSFTIAEFDRLFPTVCDEDYDWYKRFGKSNSLECIQLVSDAVNISYYNGIPNISLNLASKTLDNHLVDLITHQKTSNKKRPTSRAKSSFSLNRRFDNQRNNYHSFSNQNNYSRNNSNNRSSQPPPAQGNSQENKSGYFREAPHAANRRTTNSNGQSQNYNNNSDWTTQTQAQPIKTNLDPRLSQQQSLDNGIKPLVTHNSNQTANNSDQSATKRPAIQGNSNSIKPVIQSSKLALSIKKTNLTVASKKDKQENTNPVIEALKDHLRQRLERLLDLRNQEFRLMSLCDFYKQEFEETLDPRKYGHDGIVTLLLDPMISSHVCVDFNDSPYVTIRSRFMKTRRAAEDLNNKESIELFNFKGMKNCLDTYLEPPKDLKPKRKAIPIEDIVKFKTVRIISQQPDKRLNLEDWVEAFEFETKLHLNISDYGFTKHDEFYQELAKDTPITLSRDTNGDLIGEVFHQNLEFWIRTEIDKGNFKCIISLSKDYDRVAFPGDEFNYYKKQDNSVQYHKVSILSAKKDSEIWLMPRNPKAFQDLTIIGTTLSSYNDFRKQEMTLRLPRCFRISGCACAVYDEIENKWSRGVIVKRITDEEVVVLLVDYGKEKIYPGTALWCLMKTHLNIPVVPFCASFKSGLNCDKVSPHFKKIMQEYSNSDDILACKIFEERECNYSPIYLPKKRWIVDLCNPSGDQNDQFLSVVLYDNC